MPHAQRDSALRLGTQTHTEQQITSKQKKYLPLRQINGVHSSAHIHTAQTTPAKPAACRMHYQPCGNCTQKNTPSHTTHPLHHCKKRITPGFPDQLVATAAASELQTAPRAASSGLNSTESSTSPLSLDTYSTNRLLLPLTLKRP